MATTTTDIGTTTATTTPNGTPGDNAVGISTNSAAQTTKGRRKRRRWAPSIAGLALTASTLGAATMLNATAASAAPIDLDEDGRWGPVEDWPMIGIHSALDSNGRVVTYGTNPDGTQTGMFIYDIWTPNPSAAAGHNTLANTTNTDIFCSLQLNRADTGDMILFGGDNWLGNMTNNRGNPDINSLDAATGQLSRLPGMNRSRWYATGTTLPDGTIYVQGGLDGEDRPEHWTPEGGSQLLNLDTSGLDWYYPRNFVIPDGRIFGIDAQGRMYFISEQLDTLNVVGQLPPDYRGVNATAVMYQPGKILFFGGPTNKSVTIDVTNGNPIVTPSGGLSSVRFWVNGTLLPDGRVLATGGSTKDSTAYFYDPIETYGSNTSAEIWDPATGQWTVGDQAVVPRLYHSTALLLPDGRVLSAGGGAPGPIVNTNAELYSPDYLVAANGQPTPRIQITGLPDTEVAAGNQVDIDTSNGAAVAKVTLVKSGSVTHSFNMDQRFVELPYITDGNKVSAFLPVNDATITPGYYLLSVLDENDIPSESRLIHVKIPTPTEINSAIDGQVVRLYQAYFLRNPDQGGFMFWRRSLLNGIGLAAISDFFAGGPEFIARYGNLSNEQFIDQIYGNVLGRQADAGGRAYWLGQLGAGVTRGQVMLAFSESNEFTTKTGTGAPYGGAPNAPVNNPAPAPAPQPQPQPVGQPVSPYAAEIRRLYLGYFLREPEADGLGYWATQRQAGITLAVVSEQFALSNEFQARYGQADNAAFVDLVYLNVLQRQPDAEGRAYWVQQLDAGMTRGALMIGFTESVEFVGKVG